MEKKAESHKKHFSYYGTKATTDRCSFKIAVPNYPEYKEK